MEVRDLIQSHWDYIRKILVMCELSDKEIQEIEEFYCLGFQDGWNGNKRHLLTESQTLRFYYFLAFEHGKKHSIDRKTL